MVQQPALFNFIVIVRRLLTSRLVKRAFARKLEATLDPTFAFGVVFIAFLFAVIVVFAIVSDKPDVAETAMKGLEKICNWFLGRYPKKDQDIEEDHETDQNVDEDHDCKEEVKSKDSD